MIFDRHLLSSPQKKAAQSGQAGFSLVELMVTLSIVVLATGLVMIKYASFNSSVLLNSLAYQIAFDIREAQSLGISVRGSGGQFFEEYGMYFDISEPNQYKLFHDDEDTNASQNPVRYNDSPLDEMVGEPIIIDPRFTITDICSTDRNGSEACALEGGTNSDSVSISFARPDFNAVLWGEDMANPLRKVEIKVSPGSGATNERIIEVTAGGMISVKSP